MVAFKTVVGLIGIVLMVSNLRVRQLFQKKKRIRQKHVQNHCLPQCEICDNQNRKTLIKKGYCLFL